MRVVTTVDIARTAPELTSFCHAIAGLISEMDDDMLSELFR